MGRVFALLKFSIISVFFKPNSTKYKKLKFASFTFSCSFVLNSPITNKCNVVFSSVNFQIVIVRPEFIYHITLNTQSTELLQQMPYLLYGLCPQMIHFSMIVVKLFLLCFFLCIIASFSRDLNKDSLCASRAT